MYFKRLWTGLSPEQSYVVTFAAQIATNTEGQPACVGIGGPAGSTTVIKAGVSRAEPTVVAVPVQGDVTTKFNLSTDVGSGPRDGTQGVTLGTIGNTNACRNFNYMLKDLSSTTGTVVTADASGNAWLLIGVQFAGFEGILDAYVTKFSATFTPR
jgi:hypothetical protein